MAKFTVFRSNKNGLWYWHLRGDNNKIVSSSEPYNNRWSAKRGAKRFKTLMVNAEIFMQLK